MSRNSKNKKSTSKYRKFKVSPLIPVIAVVEVLVLIAISTYAWFVVAQEKEANTGVITVNADSGLDIDFKNANYDDEINIWDYVEDGFEFEPVTSLDGRNVFVPTSGTFNSTDTNSMVFRDATINDINSRYLNVDFMLTNTSTSNMEVYLNNNSRFKVWNGDSQTNSRALRLAFYTNDGEHGKVDSSILANTNNENAILSESTNTWTVYFKNSKGWSNVDAYIWRSENNTNYEAVSWPGSKMTRISGDIYSYTFNNPADASYQYIIFNDGTKDGRKYPDSNASQTADLTLTKDKLYNLDGTTENYATKTCYFLKPSGWSGVKAHAFVATGDNRSLTTYPGDDCVDCGADIYSYTFPVLTKINGTAVNLNKIIFSDSANQNTQTADLDAVDGKLYFSNSPYTNYTENTVYFYNSLYNSQSFAKPYAKITTSSGQTTEVAMTNLSAGVYYATVPGVYTTIVFEDGKGQTTNTKYTKSATVTDGYIYKPNENSATGWTLTSYSYSNYAANGQFAVISPGVSAGFQRAYTPVVDIASTTGVATQLIPAFASSIDNYIRGSGSPLFTIPSGGMLDLSMIVWLEGTDADCTTELYSAKDIELYLEFSTNLTERDIDNTTYYTYRFYDKTREVWTSDRLTNEAGVSVAPVMQLYDATDKRGYLMHAASTTSVNGTRKIDLWECSAPSTLVTKGHDLFFRRVDPYNEDEVWNYWHPGSAQDITDAQQSVNGKQYISFTAFADGAPASSNADSAGVNGNETVLTAAASASTPEKSCGGLWGTYETTLLTVVDGTNGFWLSKDNAALTLQYTYTYPQSGKTQKIEYKGSGPYHSQMYYFVVPKALKDGIEINDTTKSASQLASSYKIHRFWDFNGSYAMNIYKRNDSMSFDNTCDVTVNTAMTGLFMWLSNTSGSDKVDQSWFGNAINHINISYKTEGNNTDMFGGTDIQYKVAVWKTGDSKEIYLYTRNDNFQLSNFNGYAIVAPSDYTKMQLRRCRKSDWYVYNYSSELDLSNRNCVAYKYSGDTVYCDSNNNQGDYNWPTVPSYE